MVVKVRRPWTTADWQELSFEEQQRILDAWEAEHEDATLNMQELQRENHEELGNRRLERNDDGC